MTNITFFGTIEKFGKLPLFKVSPIMDINHGRKIRNSEKKLIQNFSSSNTFLTKIAEKRKFWKEAQIIPNIVWWSKSVTRTTTSLSQCLLLLLTLCWDWIFYRADWYLNIWISVTALARGTKMFNSVGKLEYIQETTKWQEDVVVRSRCTSCGVLGRGGVLGQGKGSG